MISLLIQFLKIILNRPSVMLILIVITLGIGFFTQLGYQNFLYLQAQNLSTLSVTNEIILPLAGLTIIAQIVISIVVVTQLLPNFYVLGQAGIITHSPIKRGKLLFSLWFPVFLISSWPLIVNSLIILTMWQLAALDLIRLLAIMAGMILISLCTSLLVLLISIWQKRPLLTLLISVLVILTILIGEISLRYAVQSVSWPAIFLPFFNFREGILAYADLIAYLGWIVLFATSCLLSLSKPLGQSTTMKKVSVLLPIVLLFVAGFVPGQLDISSDKRNSFSAEFTQLLNSNQMPLEIIAVINDETSRQEVTRGFQLIQSIMPDSQLKFTARQMLAQEFQHAGEYVQFTIGSQHQSVAYPFELEVKQVFENAIAQLLQRKQQWITFIEGHGEASPLGKKSSDLASLYQALQQNGWPVALQNLAVTPLISANTSLLVIASSKQQWLHKEVELVVEYLQQGGNLWLMLDPESELPEKLQVYLGVARIPGTLVDWNGFQSGTPHPAVVIVNQHLDHPIVNQLNSLLAFPWSSGLTRTTPQLTSPFQIKSVVKTQSGVWNELDIQNEQLSLDLDRGETQGSFDIALALENINKQQRVLVVGDSHFASDTAINNYANKQLTLNMVSWLTQTKNIQKETAVSRDNYIQPNRLGHFLLNWGFSILLPIMLLLIWLIARWRRAGYVR